MGITANFAEKKSEFVHFPHKPKDFTFTSNSTKGTLSGTVSPDGRTITINNQAFIRADMKILSEIFDELYRHAA